MYLIINWNDRSSLDMAVADKLEKGTVKTEFALIFKIDHCSDDPEN